MLILQYAPGLWNGGKLWRSAPRHSQSAGNIQAWSLRPLLRRREPDTIIGCVLTVSNTPLRGLGQTPPQEKAGHADMPCPFGISGPCSEAGIGVHRSLAKRR